MKIRARLFATLREGRGREVETDLPEGSTVMDLIGALRIPEKDVAILLVNGRDGRLSSVLGEADTVSIFPPVGGG